MALSESQLETWSHLYDTAAAANAHLAIRRALERHMPAEWASKVDAYLQGSYRNKTSIYRDSDVDLVLEWTGDYYRNLDRLSVIEQQRYLQDHTAPSTYDFARFRADVVAALTKEFGAGKVDATGNKAITVRGELGVRLDADVVPCFDYRFYTSYPNLWESRYVDGMTFWTQRETRQVINFPKQHIANGEQKHGSTGDWYKKTIRMFKNARNAAEANGFLTADTAPSYFIECLLFNVPDGQFGGGYGASFRDCLRWLRDQVDKSGFWCQNGVVRLFGMTPEQWQEQRANLLVQGLIALDNAS